MLDPLPEPLPEAPPTTEAYGNGDMAHFRYEEAFGRNIGWLTEHEQQVLRGKRIAIAGMGGVGGVHLATLARLGIGAFHIADLDDFELANFNRQIGATMGTLGRPKARVLEAMAKGINPQADVRAFENGIGEANIDAFLEGVDLFVDGFDFFVLDVRSRVFARCAELGIPAITAAPLGMGTAWLIFEPGGMTFEEYFRLEGLPAEKQYVNFALGVAPKGFHRRYLADPSRLDLEGRRGPSTGAACQMAAGVVATEAAKLLLGRGKIRGAPWYHHFDPYLGKWTRGKLRGGNGNPLQALKLRLAYRISRRLTADAWPTEEPARGSEVERILDLARWAPSGDNNQPWRFEVTGPDSVRVHVRTKAGEDVYDYNNGQPTLLAAGFLLESMRIAASRFGRMTWWDYKGAKGNDHVIDVDLPPTPGVTEDPLLPWLAIRSVDRRPYRTTPLADKQKRVLEDALGDELKIRWFETLPERWRMTRINARATDIRLRSPEAFHVHRRIIDWKRAFSPDGVPGRAIGLDPLARRITRWAMADWRRMNFMNRFAGGTVLARLEMDIVPGLRCAAHFSVEWAVERRNEPIQADRVSALLRAGENLQRFWLTATRLGLAVQPSLAPLCFADAAAEKHRPFLNAKLFLGRIGAPAPASPNARSIRRDMPALLRS